MILIVDDHLETCRALLRLLKLEGIEIECVGDAQSALNFIASVKPKLLVLDQMLPGLKGTELLRAIRSMPAMADIPTVFYSAAEEGEEEARRLGALTWLTKGGTTWDDLKTWIIDEYRARTAT